MMIFREKYSSLFIVGICAFFLMVSCNKNDDNTDNEIQNEFLLSSQSLGSSSQTSISFIYNLLAIDYPNTSGLVSEIKSGVNIYKITYKTTYLDQEVNASGLVCVPNVAGEFPILSFQNGTNVLYANAPTKNFKDPLFSVLEGVASMGFIVVIPDYLGFGDSEQIFHPYLHAESTVQTVLDMVRASREFVVDEDTEAIASNDLYLLGYSQGGWATLSTQKEIEQNYSSEFNLIASACGAGPYDMGSLNDYVLSQSDYPMPYFLAYILKGHREAGSISNPYSDVFKSTYANKIDQLFDGLHSGAEINSELTTSIPQLVTTEYLLTYNTNPKYNSIQSAFADNSVAAWNVTTSTRLYHASNDIYIPPFITEEMAQSFRDIGVSESKVKSVFIDGYDHPGGIIPVGVEAILWFVGK